MVSTPRPAPTPCREEDLGKFEVCKRDGWARIGKFHSGHGVLNTPAILPVINPNIKTIPPREMWDRYGIEGLITNSYIIWKHEKLRQPALENGVHELIDYPGMVMTDSGTFQSYIYGDVEVGAEEIVEFQRDIGVDVATMLDVFTRPDMSEEEWSQAVDDTLARAGPAINAAGDTLLNGPIQGGLSHNQRRRSASEMGKHPFAIHPIGGIVPLMENQQYEELFNIILNTRRNIPAGRPIHLFGCGHPLLFPLAIALGADLFDSAAYVLFARDGRLLTPEGTIHLDGLEEWPIMAPSLLSHSPADVRGMGKEERTGVLARANLETTLAELARCRQAVRDGKIWHLAEVRSHANPHLRKAWNSLFEAQSLNGDSFDDLVRSQNPHRNGGITWNPESNYLRPDVQHLPALISTRWKPPFGQYWGGDEQEPFVVVFTNVPNPWRRHLDELVIDLLSIHPSAIPLVANELGIFPYSLGDVNPIAHLDSTSTKSRLDEELFIESNLSGLGLGELPVNVIFWMNHKETMRHMIWAAIHAERIESIDQSIIDDKQIRMQVKNWLNLWSSVDKLVVFANADPITTWSALKGGSMVMSRTGRVKNIIDKDGRHLASPRLTDGGLSLTKEGARWLHSLRKQKMPVGEMENTKIHDGVGKGPSVIVIDDDAVPFVKQGRSVFHGFISGSDGWASPGHPCLLCDSKGELHGHGISLSLPVEMTSMRKGIAVRVRDGFKE